MLGKYPASLLELLKHSGPGPEEHPRCCTTPTRADRSTIWSASARSRSCASCRAWARSSRRKSCARSRPTGRRRGASCLSFGQRVADELIEYLSAVPGVEKVTPAGSLRRGKETVGDLDLARHGPGARPRPSKNSSTHPKAHEVLGKGPNKASIKFGLEGLQVDLRALAVGELRRGAAVFHRQQGAQRRAALARPEDGTDAQRIRSGARRRRRRVWRARPKKKSTRRSGLDWIPPELRENSGEIEAAAEHRLPKLVELEQIRGDLHMHTTETDGRATLEEMAEAARERGLRVHRDHGSFQGAGDGQRPGREARRRVRASRARDGSEASSACAFSPASNATSAATARWIWRTTRWRSSIG